MPKPRSPAREMAHRLWLDTEGRRPLTDIASECGVSPELVRKWKTIDKWSLDGKKKSDSGVTQSMPPATNGNGNATGNAPKGKRRNPQTVTNPNGNPNLQPAPDGNKYAVTAGEYETILYETLSDDERRLAKATVTLPPAENALRMLAILTVREKRIMSRINDRLALDTASATIGGSKMFALNALNIKTENDEGSQIKKQQVEFEAAISFVTDLEDALTRVQLSKTRVLDLLHKMQKDSLLTDLERRKVEAMEQRTAIEKKRFDFEYGRITGDGKDDPITGWLEATSPTEESIAGLFAGDDGEESP